MNPCPRFLQLVAVTKGMSIESAALNVACREPQLANAVLDFVGSYPSADPAIRTLQAKWTTR
jgi:hypothetical protein